MKLKFPVKSGKAKMIDCTRSPLEHAALAMEVDRRSLYPYIWVKWIKPKDFLKYLERGWRFNTATE